MLAAIFLTRLVARRLLASGSTFSRRAAMLLVALSHCGPARKANPALLIDAKNERVAAWYQAYGALALLDAPGSLVLPLATIEAAELTVTDGTGPALALATPLTRIDLKPGR